ncbi:DUF4767 domain-containing protein [Vagococcus silagei]|uniref:DUF4767 domain-containing protein n=2 Tax=Vagococcus silagei TaxID=2508885 RepID=A0A4S3B6S1_9ENTE|nr:DUF4767 domain-containing protein [Vagococcus silagei]
MKMKKKMGVALFLLVTLFTFSACGGEAYDQSMKKVNDAIKERKFIQADIYVEKALEKKPKDLTAQNYQKQLSFYRKSLDELEKKNQDLALSNLKQVVEIKGGSAKLVSYAKKDMEKLGTSTTKTSETSKPKEENKKTETVWNADKEKKLKQYMSDFSRTMKQQYEEYTSSNSVDMYGAKLPEDVFSGKHKMAVNEQPVEIEWSDTGEGKLPYQLVAVYSDAATQSYGAKHVYFFVIKNGQPKVFITQQNQGMPNNYIHFSETENQDLQQNFAQIVGGNFVAKEDKASATKDYPNSKLLAAKAMIKAFNQNPADTDNIGQANVSYDLSTDASYEIWTTGVHLPEEVTIVAGSPTAAGLLMYHNNNDGTVTVYPVPSHYQDHDWDDPVKGKAMAYDVINQARQIDISDVPDDAAQKLVAVFNGDV